MPESTMSTTRPEAVNCAWFKPMDANQIAAICAQSRAVVVLEEHSVLGGLGSAIA
jgi:transketolase C-terminal domain/subunit